MVKFFQWKPTHTAMYILMADICETGLTFFSFILYMTSLQGFVTPGIIRPH